MSPSSLDPVRLALKKSSYVVHEEGLRSFMSRLGRIAVVKARRILQSKSDNLGRWSALKNRFAGQRAFLIGNGPSLNETPLHLLRDEHVMCFNRFYLMFERLGWRPTMFAMSDDRVAADIAEDLVREILPVVDLAFFPDLHPYNVDFRKFIPAWENVHWLYLDRLDFSDSLPWAGMNKTVSNVGLQILAYLGFNPIYLIGVDMSYSRPESVVASTARDWTSTADDDPNHFDPRYFGKGRRYHAPRMDETRERYERAKEFYGSRGIEIYNAGVGGELDVFPRVQLRSLFPQLDLDEEMKVVRQAASSCVGVTAARSSGPPDRQSCADAFPSGSWVDGPVCRSKLPGILKTQLVFGPIASGEYFVVPRATGPAW